MAGGAADPGRGARYDRPKPDADAGRSLIAKGAPIGDPASGRDLIRTLREKADRGGKRRAFHGASPACLPVFLDLGLPITKMAEVGRVDLTRRAFDGPWRKDFRHARGRAAREGHAFEIARACDPAPAAPKLRAISDAWLASKHGAEKGFSLGAAPFSGLDDRPLAPQWTRIGGFVHDHGDRFCNVEGLRGFREKLDPVRTLNHLAGPGGMAAPRVRHEVNLLVSGGVRGLAA